jgi:hypothetical protein
MGPWRPTAHAARELRPTLTAEQETARHSLGLPRPQRLTALIEAGASLAWLLPSLSCRNVHYMSLGQDARFVGVTEIIDARLSPVGGYLSLRWEQAALWHCLSPSPLNP